jgi:hypothetical protein
LPSTKLEHLLGDPVAVQRFGAPSCAAATA